MPERKGENCNIIKRFLRRGIKIENPLSWGIARQIAPGIEISKEQFHL